MRLVYSFFSDGHAEGTLKDGFFDPKLGPRKIDRMTLIEHDDERQAFFIHWLKGPRAGTVQCDDHGGIAYFGTYEAAVVREIELVNALRLQGVSFQ